MVNGVFMPNQASIPLENGIMLIINQSMNDDAQTFCFSIVAGGNLFL